MDHEMEYTVKQLARLAGVSARALHYYDQIGLLKPGSLGENGYRYYGTAALLRLQQILFFKELEFRLSDIKQILDRPDFDLVRALQAHRLALEQRAQRLNRLAGTIDHTIAQIQGGTEVEPKKLFEEFSEEQQKEYDAEAKRRWGSTDAYKESQKRWGTYTAEDKKRMGEEGEAVYRDMVAAMPLGPASAQAQACVARWRQHLRYFYEPSNEMLLGLADMYNDDPAFAANFQRIDPGLASFMRQAIQHFCAESAVRRP
jgi:MerR family transcriptional regulator, thiopeptide resistance regulator